MTYVIAEPCIDVLDQACVSVCPVDCIHYDEGTDRMDFIDPEECIDCAACLPECPIEAIVETEDQAPEWAEINKDLTPQFKGNPQPEPRPMSDPPRKPENRRGEG